MYIDFYFEPYVEKDYDPYSETDNLKGASKPHFFNQNACKSSVISDLSLLLY